jgi:hypothetical protein
MLERNRRKASNHLKRISKDQRKGRVQRESG